VKIRKVRLKNFRCYKEETVIDIDDLTVFVGPNDSGKSTILEALDLFINEGKGTVKFEKADCSLGTDVNEETRIGVAFEPPESLVIDATVQVSPKDQFLLNEDGLIEIVKVFREGARQIPTYLRCLYPANDNFLKNLLNSKIDDLRNFAEERQIPCGDRRIASQLRDAIIKWYEEKDGELKKEITEIPIDAEGLKRIWPQIEKYLPIYSLFKVDRTNLDENDEIQDPIKTEIQRVIKSEQVNEKLKKVEKEILEACRKKAEMTLKKLRELNPQVAKDLQPHIPTALKWEAVFKQLSFMSDEGIPLNKRGSGARRLVLLSSLLAETEEIIGESDNCDIVYAIEEPETSLHPDWQRKLVDAILQLVENGNRQFLLTTHSPQLAQLFHVNSLRLVEKATDSMQSTVKSGKEDETILNDIAQKLGILPWLGKLAICVEGERDREFLLNINKAIPELSEIIKLTDASDSPIAIIPLHGGNLKNWVDRWYLKNTSIVEFHLYDRDLNKNYLEAVNKVNARGDGSHARFTKKREIENYVHWKLIEEKFGIIFTEEEKNGWDELDIPGTVMKRVAGKKEDNIKRIICGELSQKMTKELLEDLNAWEEVKGWFEKIKEMYNRLPSK